MCKGQRYKANITNFINNQEYFVSTTKMMIQKRLSCPGCEECGGDLLPGHVTEGDIPLLDNIVHGKIYRLTMVNISRDWESGHIDGYDLKFVVDDNKQNEYTGVPIKPLLGLPNAAPKTETP